MKRKFIPSVLLFLLALIFAGGLMFAFLELPEWLDKVIQKNVSTPGFDPAYDPMRANLFFEAYFIKLIGYICLGLVLASILVGFLTRKSGWIWAGALIVFLPVFGTFAVSMFYLAGLGLFNTLMYPFMDISLELLKLGHVVLIPYWILMWFFGSFDWYAHDFLMYFFMALGAAIFVISVFIWFQTRYEKRKVAKGWLYRISRHPQYLGWIIWSYGLMLYGPTLNNMKRSWGWTGSLAWLLSTLVIIGICMLEEVKMQELAGDDYDSYRKRTPFMFPIPEFLRKVFKAPARLIVRSGRPVRGSQIAGIVGVYALLFMSLSLFWVDFEKKQGNNNQIALAENGISAEGDIRALLKTINTTTERRDLSEPIWKLTEYRDEGGEALMELSKNSNPHIREFSMQGLAMMNYRLAIPLLVTALDDSIGYVARQAARSLATMKAIEAEERLLFYLKNPTRYLNKRVTLTALISIGSDSIRNEVYELMNSDLWYEQSAAMSYSLQLDGEAAWPAIYDLLKDPDQNTRRDAVKLILEHLPKNAVPYLETVIEDEIWEVRFYAKQAVKQINQSTK